MLKNAAYSFAFFSTSISCLTLTTHTHSTYTHMYTHSTHTVKSIICEEVYVIIRDGWLNECALAFSIHDERASYNNTLTEKVERESIPCEYATTLYTEFG